jgi:hypothetical protein
VLFAAVFRLLVRLRRGRALHLVGLGYHACLEITPGDDPGDAGLG